MGNVWSMLRHSLDTYLVTVGVRGGVRVRVRVRVRVIR